MAFQNDTDVKVTFTAQLNKIIIYDILRDLDFVVL